MLTVQTNTMSDGRVRLANYSIYSPTLRGDVTEGGEPGALVFDTRAHVSWWPETNFSEWVHCLFSQKFVYTIVRLCPFLFVFAFAF